MKQFQAYKWSDDFLKLLYNEDKSLDMEEYDFCTKELKSAHESKTIRYYIYTIILFVGGMWAVYENALFIAVLLLALAHNYNRQSSHHILMYEMLNQQRLLAMFINKVSNDVKSKNTENNNTNNESFEQSEDNDYP